MTTDRAAEMIEHDVEILSTDPADTLDRTHGPGAIAQALTDGGLLAPDLPPPDTSTCDVIRTCSTCGARWGER